MIIVTLSYTISQLCSKEHLPPGALLVLEKVSPLSLSVFSPLITYPLLAIRYDHCTVVQNGHVSRRVYWATRSSVRLFTRTTYSFARFGLLASLAPSAALTRLLARSLRSLPRSWESELLMSQNDLVLSHSVFLLLLLLMLLFYCSFYSSISSASSRARDPEGAGGE